VTYTVEKTETDSPECPNALQKKDIQTHYPYIWTIGNIDILNRKLRGFFCSIKCPGDGSYEKSLNLSPPGFLLKDRQHIYPPKRYNHSRQFG